MSEHGVEMARAGNRLSDFIQSRLPAILEEWERRARSFPVAERLQGVVLRDHVPQILERIAAMLQSVPGSLGAGGGQPHLRAGGAAARPGH
jgi:hypothetical protein